MKRLTVPILLAAALAAALIPLPPSLVEHWYSRGIYPIVQRALTSVSSVVPFALLDVASIALIAAWLLVIVRRWRQRGAAGAVRAAAVSAIAGAAVLYLLFVVLWGLNYRRVPLEEKLAYDASRVTREHIRALAGRAIERVNTLQPASVASGGSSGVALEAAFAETQRRLGSTRTARPAAAKRSLLSWYLRRAGIDGMVNPIFLEVILNPDILPIERPFSLAHEWGHLAGYADESEANFLAWLTCVSADPAAQYSGWLEAYRYAAAALPRDDRRELQQRLAPAVLADLQAINERLGRAHPAVSGFARNVYDSYLRAHGVEEGIASYSAMLRLMTGTSFENGWVPKLRS